jgi:hypothetical protein
MESTETVISRSNETRWPLAYIAGGLLILAALSSLAFFEFFPYRPWIAVPMFFVLEAGMFLLLFLYARLVIKKQGEWPVLRIGSLSAFIHEAVRAVIYVIMIGFVVGLAALSLEAFLDRTVELPEKLKVIRNAPNSLTLI